MAFETTSISKRRSSFTAEVSISTHAKPGRTKFANFVKFSSDDDNVAKELPAFILEIKQLFTRKEIEDCFNELWTLEPWGHTSDQETHMLMQDEEAIGVNPLDSAKDILIVEKMKKYLLDN